MRKKIELKFENKTTLISTLIQWHEPLTDDYTNNISYGFITNELSGKKQYE